MAWRLITTYGASPELAMGLDEALLARAGPPTVRFYTFEPDTLSLGYFQRPEDVPAAGRASALVRRVTGGGAIHHVRELTFSLTTSRADPLYRGPVAESYRRVHAAVAAALRSFGVEARLRGADELASDRPGTGMCFHRSTPLDLAWGGRKGVGSAQRRRGGRVLHHGSIKLGASELEPGTATLELPGRAAPSLAELASAMAEAFARSLQLHLDPAEPSASELLEAHERGARYSDPAWTAAPRR